MRNCSALIRASAACTRDRAVCSAVRYWLTCCALMAPESRSLRARSALADASASAARASASAADCCARSLATEVVTRVASGWSRVTRSPTFTRTSAIRKPPTSGLITTSCQAATVPSASSRVCHSTRFGLTAVTVIAGLAATVALGACTVVSRGAGSRKWNHQADTPSTTTSTRALTHVEAEFLIALTLGLRSCHGSPPRKPAQVPGPSRRQAPCTARCRRQRARCAPAAAPRRR